MKQITSTTVGDGQLMKKIVNLEISIYPGCTVVSVNLTAFLKTQGCFLAIFEKTGSTQKERGLPSSHTVWQIHLVVVFSVEYSKTVCSTRVVAVPHAVKFLFHCTLHPLQETSQDPVYWFTLLLLLCSRPFYPGFVNPFSVLALTGQAY